MLLAQGASRPLLDPLVDALLTVSVSALKLSCVHRLLKADGALLRSVLYLLKSDYVFFCNLGSVNRG